MNDYAKQTQNKPYFRKAKMNVGLYLTKTYENNLCQKPAPNCSCLITPLYTSLLRCRKRPTSIKDHKISCVSTQRSLLLNHLRRCNHCCHRAQASGRDTAQIEVHQTQQSYRLRLHQQVYRAKSRHTNEFCHGPAYSEQIPQL